MENVRKFRSIGWDMDGVVFNFAKRYAEVYSARHPDDIVTEADIEKNWDVCKTTRYGDKLWKEPGFIAGMEPYPGMDKIFRWAYKNYPSYVVTAIPANLHQERIDGIKKICPEFNDWDIFFANRKEMIGVDVLFDDAPHNLLRPGHTVVVDRWYNQHIQTLPRVSSPEETRLFIEKNCERRFF